MLQPKSTRTLNRHINPNKTEAQTISYYNDHAKQWAEKYTPDTKASFWAPELKQFQEYVPSGKILEIGFGGAKETVEINK